MRLAVLELAGRGGMSHYVYQLCRGLSAAGLDVTLVTDRHYELDALAHPFRLAKILRLWDAKPASTSTSQTASNGLVRRLRRFGRAVVYYREWARAIVFLRRERFDLVQLGDLRFASDLVCVLAMRLLGIRLVDICHNVRPFSSHGGGGTFRVNRAGKAMFQKMYDQFERVVVHFEVNRRAFEATFRVPPERLIVIPMGNESIFEELRDPRLTAGDIRMRLGLRPDERVVMFFGTLSFYKGLDLLVKAFARVQREHPDTRLVIVGHPLSGFDIDGLRREAQALDVEARTIFETRYLELDEVAAWMELAAVTVFPYRDVYQSAAVQVAQTLGAPTIVSDVGAMREVVVDGETGLLAPRDDVLALASAIRRVLDDPSLARRLGEAARRDAMARFGWNTIGRALAASYLDVAGAVPKTTAALSLKKRDQTQPS